MENNICPYLLCSEKELENDNVDIFKYYLKDSKNNNTISRFCSAEELYNHIKYIISDENNINNQKYRNVLIGYKIKNDDIINLKNILKIKEDEIIDNILKNKEYQDNDIRLHLNLFKEPIEDINVFKNIKYTFTTFDNIELNIYNLVKLSIQNFMRRMSDKNNRQNFSYYSKYYCMKINQPIYQICVYSEPLDFNKITIKFTTDIYSIYDKNKKEYCFVEIKCGDLGNNSQAHISMPSGSLQSFKCIMDYKPSLYKNNEVIYTPYIYKGIYE